MKIKKPVSAVLSSFLIVSTLNITNINAGGWIYTNHGTYINTANGKEYYVEDNREVEYGHMAVCVDYANYIASISQPVTPTDPDDSSITPDEKIEEDIVKDDNTEEKIDPDLPTGSTEKPSTEEKTDEKLDDKIEEKLDETPVEKVDDKLDEDASISDEKVEDKKEEKVTDEKDKKDDKEKPSDSINQKIKDDSPVTDTWYHPLNLNPEGYTGEIKKAIRKDNFVTSNWNAFRVSGNPFQFGQCTYFAWSRFYQVYGFDNGARGNGKLNAAEVVRAHKDDFVLSSTPAAGAIYSIEKNSTYPQFGHVGFIEAFDGEYIWISEGNVEVNGIKGNIWIHKAKWETFKQDFPDATFAVPKQKSSVAKKAQKLEIRELEKQTLKFVLKGNLKR